jgi:hypothetical protein
MTEGSKFKTNAQKAAESVFPPVCCIPFLNLLIVSDFEIRISESRPAGQD